jgi:hypothetical protein
MFTTVSVQLPSHVLVELIQRLERCSGSKDVSLAIASAVEFWLADKNQFPKKADPDGLHGYQWKCLFLPEGTVLRSWSYGEHNYARVEGDHIIHKGREVSPNQFARSFARSNRNAWDDLFIRRPGDKQFKLACILRKEVQRTQAEVQKPQTQPAAALAAKAGTHASTPSQSAVSPPPEQRDTSQREDWSLPERRKWRIRLEDIAFD